MGSLLALVDRRRAFAVVFAVLAASALLIGWRNPLGPGEDQHYHLMTAWITSRWWLGDAHVRSLYTFINPLDANTFVYTFLFPFEAVMKPLDAWRLGFTLLYFIGYPLGCVVALHLLRRPLWGALLAFPLAYTKSWSHAGDMPFLSAAPFFVLSIAAMHRVLGDAQEPPPTSDATRRSRRRALVTAVVAPATTVLANGHVYQWLLVLLGTVTLLVLLRALVKDLPRFGLGALLSAARLASYASFVVAPSLVLFAVWFWQTHRGAVAPASTWNDKIVGFASSFAQLTDDAEWGWVGASMCALLLVVLLAGRLSRRELPTPEIATLLTLVSFFALPTDPARHGIDVRHVDLFLWLVPLVVVPALPEGRLRMLVGLGILLGFSVMRLAFLRDHLTVLDGEIIGIGKLARPCPAGRARLAFATFGGASQTWDAPSLRSAHETYAALCGLDVRLPERDVDADRAALAYRDGVPAPPPTIADDPRWWERPRLWEEADLVLVRNWRPSARDLEEVQRVAVRLRIWDEWQLWHRKPAIASAQP